MKFNKIFAIALAALTFTACGNDDDEPGINTANATVSMQEDAMSISEDVVSGVYQKIPVVVTGETNGNVKVTIAVTATGDSPAAEDKDYVFTSYTINIPAGENGGYFEFYPVGDEIINEDRTFTVTIVSAEGATVGTQKSCNVTLIDNERLVPEAYAKIQGEWVLDLGTGDQDFEIVGYPEDDPRYLKEVMTYGWNGYAWMQASARMLLDAVTHQITLQFPYGQVMAEDVEFTDLGAMNVQLWGYDGSYVYQTGNLTMISNPEQNSFSSEGMGMTGALMQGDSFSGYVWFRTLSVKLRRP